ncbi:uncharacterized protein LOC120817657 isoform X1 [Gasterosteus aculeatus]
MMEESVSTFETHLTAVMDSLIRASVCEVTKLFQDMVNDYLVEISLNRKENDALKQRLRLTENKLRTERKYGMGWAATRRNAGLAAAAATEDGAAGRQKRKVEGPPPLCSCSPLCFSNPLPPPSHLPLLHPLLSSNSLLAFQSSPPTSPPPPFIFYYISFLSPGGPPLSYLLPPALLPLSPTSHHSLIFLSSPQEASQRRARQQSMEKAGLEFAQTEAYQPASLQLIREALKMDPPIQNLHACSRAQSKGDLSDRPSSLHSGARDEDWESDSAEPSEGGMTMDELRGLESALRAERGREQAALTTPEPVSPDSEAEQGSEGSLAPKYIGLDGMEQDEELEPPTLQREEQTGRGRAKDVEMAAGEPRSGWSKRSREDDSAASVSGEDAAEQGEPAHLPHLCAPGSVGESVGEEEGGGDLLHFCPQCGGGFTSQAEREEHPCPLGESHLQDSGEDVLHPCAHCGTTFSHAWALKNHECACAAERPHCCEICGKRFTHSRSLERHQLVHTGERPHRCPQCGRSFSRLGNLERHQRIHTGERPYGCEACGKRFSRVEYLKRHQLIHTSEKAALQCSNCGSGFSDLEQLKNHQCF